METLLAIVLFVVAAIAAAIASVTGFGIGSLLTPVLGLAVGTKIAVAAVSLPHFIGTAIRFWMLRRDVDRSVLWRFGLASAAGGLTGALLHSRASTPALSVIFGSLLIFVAISELSGLAKRMKLHGTVALLGGALSGLLGGLVGNPGRHPLGGTLRLRSSEARVRCHGDCHRTDCGPGAIAGLSVD